MEGMRVKIKIKQRIQQTIWMMTCKYAKYETISVQIRFIQYTHSFIWICTFTAFTLLQILTCTCVPAVLSLCVVCVCILVPETETDSWVAASTRPGSRWGPGPSQTGRGCIPVRRSVLIRASQRLSGLPACESKHGWGQDLAVFVQRRDRCHRGGVTARQRQA